MKKINIACLIFSVLMASGCYKDKGNYDYTDIKRVEIQFDKISSYTITQGDVLEVNPIYPDFVLANPDNYEFTWYLNDETRPEWNTMNFKWQINDLMERGNLVIEVRDKSTDVKYMNRAMVTVNGVYTNYYSWMILSDDGGKSKLSFLSVNGLLDPDSADQPQGSDQYYYDGERFITNVYNGDLGSGPIALQEHWREGIDYSETVIGNVCVFQKSGAVDLEGTGFTKEIDMVDAFVGQKYPASNTVLYPGSFIQYADVVCDQDGKLYSRLKLSDNVYNSEYFLQSPLKVRGEEEVLENCRVCRGYYTSNRFGYQVVYDGKNKRFLYFQDGGSSWDTPAEGASAIVPVKVDSKLYLEDVVHLDNHNGYELLHLCQSAATGAGWNSYYGFYEVLREEATDKLFLQQFILTKKYGADSPDIQSITKKEIKGLPGIPSVMAFPTYNPTEYAFFAIGKKLYMVDLVNMSDAELYYEFDSDITAMDYGSSSNIHLAVGLEDGSFFVLGANAAKNIKDEHKLVYKAPEKVGKIVDIKYKNNSMWNY